MGAGHDHDHDHDPISEGDEISEFEVLEAAVRELAIEKGLFSAEDHRRFLEYATSIGPTERLEAGREGVGRPGVQAAAARGRDEASEEIEGINWRDPTGSGTPSDYTYFYVLENTPEVHNVIVCTLCSCYPRPVLGMSPDWYRTPHYRRRLVRWPREVLAEFGLHFPPEVEVRVHDSNQKSRFMVMPMRPEGTEDWSEEELAKIVTRDTMIGVALPDPELEREREPGGGAGVSEGGYEVLLGVVEAEANGGAAPMPVAERDAAPWESSMEAVCESLALRGALDNLERRNAEDELGQTVYAGSPRPHPAGARDRALAARPRRDQRGRAAGEDGRGAGAGSRRVSRPRPHARPGRACG